MAKSLLRTDEEISEIYNRNKDTIYRVCFAYMKNYADTEDAVQETFIKLINKAPVFESREHEKAWLIRTASNFCKSALRSPRREHTDIDELVNIRSQDKTETDEVLDAVLHLPEKYKTVVYLYYYEGYSGVEISRMLRKPQSTVRTYLKNARLLLKDALN